MDFYMQILLACLHVYKFIPSQYIIWDSELSLTIKKPLKDLVKDETIRIPHSRVKLGDHWM